MSGNSRRERKAKKQAEQAAKQRARLVKQAKSEFAPSLSRIPRAVFNPDNADDNSVHWSFVAFDAYDWRKPPHAGHATFCEIASRLAEYSRLTWKQIIADPKRDHPCALGDLGQEAQNRLKELQLETAGELWRFRFTGTQRIWGMREGSHFIVLWWDPDHQVYPTAKPHT